MCTSIPLTFTRYKPVIRVTLSPTLFRGLKVGIDRKSSLSFPGKK